MCSWCLIKLAEAQLSASHALSNRLSRKHTVSWVSFMPRSELQGAQQREETERRYLITIHIVFHLSLAGENTHSVKHGGTRKGADMTARCSLEEQFTAMCAWKPLSNQPHSCNYCKCGKLRGNVSNIHFPFSIKAYQCINGTNGALVSFYIYWLSLDSLPLLQMNQSWHETGDELNILWLNQQNIVYRWHETRILFSKRCSVSMKNRLCTNHHQPLFVLFNTIGSRICI